MANNEKVDWNKYQGYEADFIHPQNREAGWQYGAEIVGSDQTLFEGMGDVKVRDKDGNYVLIPVELANGYIVLHSKERPDNLVDD
jgi:hypothetical protein